MQADDSKTQHPLKYGVDIIAGSDFKLGSYQLDAASITAFTHAWDPQVFHVDPQAAEAGAYGGLIASGIQSLGVYQLLAVRSVYSHWSVIAGRGLRDVRFLRAVRPGDTLTGAMHIETVHFDGRDRAVVDTVGTLANQHGQLVLRLNMEVCVRSHSQGE